MAIYSNGMRELIVSEIKKLAAASGGKPPGREAFENATGIKPHQWRGKLWAKWSDALAEAGLAANTLQQKLDLNSVFERYAQAVRAHGSEPSTSELDMLRTSDPSFPSYKSVINHFESKSELFAKLKAWASERPDFEDVAKLLPEQVVQRPSSPALKEGYVYLIKSGGFYKIGRGDELEKRVKQIRTALPDASTLEHAIRTDDPPGIEAYWHRRFDDKRANGEWFKLTATDVAAFKRRKFQ